MSIACVRSVLEAPVAQAMRDLVLAAEAAARRSRPIPRHRERGVPAGQADRIRELADGRGYTLPCGSAHWRRNPQGKAAA
jgi:hypothetical protein